MLNRCSLARAVVAIALAAGSASVHAGPVLLNNLDQSPEATASNPFVGQSFIAGTVSETLYGAKMQLDPTDPPTSGIVLEVEARNFDGTVGATLFSNFSSSFDPATGLVTFTANSHFDLTAGTGYWLVLSDTSNSGVTWEFTAVECLPLAVRIRACRPSTPRGPRLGTTDRAPSTITNRRTAPSSSS